MSTPARADDRSRFWTLRVLLVLFARVLLMLIALDALAFGAWAAFDPKDLIALLRLKPPAHETFLWPALGVFHLLHLPLLAAAVAWPRSQAGLAVVPLLAHLLQCGLWIFLWATPRVAADAAGLAKLLSHDAALVVLCAVALVVWRFPGRVP